MQLYSIPIPVYGPHHYTTFEKKIDVDLSEQSGSGATNNEQTEAELKSETQPLEKDSVLDKLNGTKKAKLDNSIYSSFLHPNKIETSSISIGVKRKISPKTETGSGSSEAQQENDNKKRKLTEPKHKFHLI